MNGRLFLLSGTLLPLLACSQALAQFGSNVQYFPQFAINGGAETFFTIHNPGENNLTVNLSLTRSNGSPFLSDQVSVAAGATETFSYGGPSGTATAGWAKLTSSSEFSATLFYRIAGVGNVGVLPSPEAKAMKVFTFVGEGTDTGFAVANPSDTEGTVLSFAIFDAAGQLQREASLHLDHREHRAFLFSESAYGVEGNGSVAIWATNPVVALALRLDGSLLAGVGVVVPGLPIRGEWTDESPNIIGGYRENRVREGMVGGTVGGGGNSPEIPDGGANFVTGDYGTVGGGKRNTADVMATVSGGDQNVASGWMSTVSGGQGNVASNEYCTVGGGRDHTASGRGSTIAGGTWNTANAELSTVGGGGANEATGCTSTVSGGFGNDASGDGATVGGGGYRCAGLSYRGNFASGDWSTIAGGLSNEASGEYAMVAGGYENIAASTGSFAAGMWAEALHYGTFVWADDRSPPFQSTAPRQFLISAQGGVGINTNSPHGALDVNGAIYQRGNSLHADYVFDPGYELESIEEHSRLMWTAKHLPALPGREKDDQGREIVEYGSRMQGMLEELEKAHVYIEQLNARLDKLEAMLEKR